MDLAAVIYNCRILSTFFCLRRRPARDDTLFLHPLLSIFLARTLFDERAFRVTPSQPGGFRSLKLPTFEDILQLCLIPSAIS